MSSTSAHAFKNINLTNIFISLAWADAELAGDESHPIPGLLPRRELGSSNQDVFEEQKLRSSSRFEVACLRFIVDKR